MKRIVTGLLAVLLLAVPVSLVPTSPASAQVAVGFSVSIGPPLLPLYPQPLCPGAGYIWVPGYWAYGPYGYYWVPGAWVLPPRVGLLWTPGYWAWEAGYYRWRPGYWGPHVGFYGGIDYGYGYPGRGYYGGYWRGRHFYYNAAVNNVDRHRIRFAYSKPLPPRREGPRVSFNGGKGGVDIRPIARERAWSRERRYEATAAQRRHVERSREDPAMRYDHNRGKPEWNRRVERARPQPAVRRPEPVKPVHPPGSRPPLRESPVNRPDARRPPVGEKRPGKPPPKAKRPGKPPPKKKHPGKPPGGKRPAG